MDRLPPVSRSHAVLSAREKRNYSAVVQMKQKRQASTGRPTATAQATSSVVRGHHPRGARGGRARGVRGGRARGVRGGRARGVRGGRARGVRGGRARGGLGAPNRGNRGSQSLLHRGGATTAPATTANVHSSGISSGESTPASALQSKLAGVAPPPAPPDEKTPREVEDECSERTPDATSLHSSSAGRTTPPLTPRDDSSDMVLPREGTPSGHDGETALPAGDRVHDAPSSTTTINTTTHHAMVEDQAASHEQNEESTTTPEQKFKHLTLPPPPPLEQEDSITPDQEERGSRDDVHKTSPRLKNTQTPSPLAVEADDDVSTLDPTHTHSGRPTSHYSPVDVSFVTEEDDAPHPKDSPQADLVTVDLRLTMEQQVNSYLALQRSLSSEAAHVINELMDLPLVNDLVEAKKVLMTLSEMERRRNTLANGLERLLTRETEIFSVAELNPRMSSVVSPMHELDGQENDLLALLKTIDELRDGKRGAVAAFVRSKREKESSRAGSNIKDHPSSPQDGTRHSNEEEASVAEKEGQSMATATNSGVSARPAKAQYVRISLEDGTFKSILLQPDHDASRAVKQVAKKTISGVSDGYCLWEVPPGEQPRAIPSTANLFDVKSAWTSAETLFLFAPSRGVPPSSPPSIMDAGSASSPRAAGGVGSVSSSPWIKRKAATEEEALQMMKKLNKFESPADGPSSVSKEEVAIEYLNQRKDCPLGQKCAEDDPAHFILFSHTSHRPSDTQSAWGLQSHYGDGSELVDMLRQEDTMELVMDGDEHEGSSAMDGGEEILKEDIADVEEEATNADIADVEEETTATHIAGAEEGEANEDVIDGNAGEQSQLMVDDDAGVHGDGGLDTQASVCEGEQTSSHPPMMGATATTPPSSPVNSPESIDDLPWYHGAMSSSEAASMLSGKSCGSFLLRFSDRSDLFVVSYVNSDGRILHTRMYPDGDGYREGGIASGRYWDRLSQVEKIFSIGIPNKNEERRRKEEEGRRRKEEDERKRKEEEERIRKEEEERRRKEEEERIRKEEEERIRKEEEERIRKEEEERKRKEEEERKRKEEEERKRKEEEERIRKEEEERKRKEEEERKRKEEEERKRKEEERKRKEEEERIRKEEEERIRKEEENTTGDEPSTDDSYVPYSDVEDVESSPFSLPGGYATSPRSNFHNVDELNAAVGELLGDLLEEEQGDDDGDDGDDGDPFVQDDDLESRAAAHRSIDGGGSELGGITLRKVPPAPPSSDDGHPEDSSLPPVPRTPPHLSGGAHHNPHNKDQHADNKDQHADNKDHPHHDQGHGHRAAPRAPSPPKMISRGYLWVRERKLASPEASPPSPIPSGPPKRFSLRAKLKARHVEWRRYWFVLRGGALYYYSDNRLLHGLGVIDLLFCHVKSIPAEDAPSPPTAQGGGGGGGGGGGRRPRFVLVLPDAEHSMCTEDGVHDEAWIRSISEEIAKAGKTALQLEAKRLREIKRKSVMLARPSEIKSSESASGPEGVSPSQPATMDVSELVPRASAAPPAKKDILSRLPPPPPPLSGDAHEGPPLAEESHTAPSMGSGDDGRPSNTRGRPRDVPIHQMRLSQMRRVGEDELLEEFHALLQESDSALQDIAAVIGVSAYSADDARKESVGAIPTSTPMSMRPRAVVKEGGLRLRRLKGMWKKKRFDQVWAVLVAGGTLQVFASRQDSLRGEPLDRVVLMLACIREIGETDAMSGVAHVPAGNGAEQRMRTRAITSAVAKSSGGKKFSRARGVTRSSAAPSNELHVFEVVTTEKKFVLRAKSADECAAWVRALNHVKKDQMRDKLRHTLTERKASFLNHLRQNESEEEYLSALERTTSWDSAPSIDGTESVPSDSTIDPRDAMRKLRDLLCIKGNNVCADCHTPSPRWANVAFGVFLCIECAGVHRGLDRSVNKVRSLTLDAWSAADLAAMERAGGHAAVNAKWEARVPRTHARPSTSDARVQFIHAKWVEKKYMR